LVKKYLIKIPANQRILWLVILSYQLSYGLWLFLLLELLNTKKITLTLAKLVNGATGNEQLHPRSSVKARRKLALLPVDLLDLEVVRDRPVAEKLYW